MDKFLTATFVTALAHTHSVVRYFFQNSSSHK